MRVLLVEDDCALSSAVEAFLRTKDYVVDVARSLAAAKVAIPLAQWDAVLLDLGLPDGDGSELLPIIRRRYPDTPIIILSARDQISDRVQGLDEGADDFLVKPFAPEELLARLRAIDRRRSGGTSSTVTVGDLVIDLARSEVLAKGVAIELTAKEWTLLRVVATRADRIHSKDALTSALYGFDDEVGSNTLEVYISHLRRKLGRNAIQTLRGRGYRLTGDCSV